MRTRGCIESLEALSRRSEACTFKRGESQLDDGTTSRLDGLAANESLVASDHLGPSHAQESTIKNGPFTEILLLLEKYVRVLCFLTMVLVF